MLRLLCVLAAAGTSYGFVTSSPATKPRLIIRQNRISSLVAVAPSSAANVEEADLVAAAPPRIRSLPCGDELDSRIWKLALPAFVNFLILPITGAVDLFFIGKLGSALAAAGQSAANQVYSTAALLTNVIPVVTVPLVAKAHAAKDQAEVQRQVGGAIFLSVFLAALVTLLVGLGSSKWL